MVTFGPSLRDDEVDGGLLERLRAELTGIINHLAVAAKNLWARGRFQPGPGHKGVMTRMQFGIDPVEHLVRVHCESDPGNMDGIPGAEIQAAIRAVADKLGAVDMLEEKKVSGLMHRFSDLAGRLHGAERHSSNGIPRYRFIRLVGLE